MKQIDHRDRSLHVASYMSTLTPEARDALIAKGRSWQAEYGKAAALADPEVLVRLNDVQLVSRMDAIEATSLKTWKRDKLVADLTAAGDGEQRVAEWHAAARADGVARVSWPAGYDRDKAIAELRAAGMYHWEMKPAMSPTDHWVLGALQRLLDRRYLDAGWARAEAGRVAQMESIKAEHGAGQRNDSVNSRTKRNQWRQDAE